MEQDSKKGGFPGNIGEVMQGEEFQDFFKNFAGSMMGDEASQDPNLMDNLMGEFSKFMEENQDNSELKDTLDSMMNQMLSPDALLPPMKKMKEAFPGWLEKNHEKLAPEDLERFNNQLDTLEEVVKGMEDSSIKEDQLIEHLNKLQEYGAPPEDLLNEIGLGFPGGMMPPPPGMGMPGMGMPGMPDFGAMGAFPGMGQPPKKE